MGPGLRRDDVICSEGAMNTNWIRVSFAETTTKENASISILSQAWGRWPTLRVYCESLCRFRFGFASHRVNTKLSHFALEDFGVSDLRHLNRYSSPTRNPMSESLPQ